MSNKPRPVQILLVEDNPGDVRLTEEALREAHIAMHMHAVPDGLAALEKLRATPDTPDTRLPDIILLDLNLPRMSGLEFLQTLKSDPHLQHLPVIILTTSDAQADITACYRLGANAYVTKPVDLDHFIRVVQTFEEFWFFIAKLP
ncbi:MAG: response regulator [Anaerolineales bacterium]